MRPEVRPVLSLLGVAFTAYLTVGGLIWTTPVAQPLVLLAALALYLATTWLCIFWNTRVPEPEEGTITRGLGRRSLLPAWAAVLALACAVIVPNATWLGTGPAGRMESFATWSMGAIGALMTIVMVRRRPWVAWAGVLLLTVEAAAWIGVPAALSLGLVGAVLWVGTAQLLVWMVDRAARDTADLTELQRAASEWLASQEGGRRERRAQVQRALAVAGPVLSRTIETGGALDEEERSAARLAEGALRDELRAAPLLDDAVRTQLDAARRRGAAVSVLDEGGLDGLDAEALTAIRSDLADALTGASSERLYVRTSTHSDIAVTVVGRSHGPDGEDTVDLWREITRP